MDVPQAQTVRQCDYVSKMDRYPFLCSWDGIEIRNHIRWDSIFSLVLAKSILASKLALI